MFFYESWDVFKACMRLREIATELSKFKGNGAGADLDQLRRCASSCVMNLAEGAMQKQPGKKLDRYCTVHGSAGEANGVFLVLRGTLPSEAIPLIDEGREVANRVSAMMTNLIRNTEQRRDEAEKNSDPPPPPPPPPPQKEEPPPPQT